MGTRLSADKNEERLLLGVPARGSDSEERRFSFVGPDLAARVCSGSMFDGFPRPSVGTGGLSPPPKDATEKLQRAAQTTDRRVARWSSGIRRRPKS